MKLVTFLEQFIDLEKFTPPLPSKNSLNKGDNNGDNNVSASKIDHTKQEAAELILSANELSRLGKLSLGECQKAAELYPGRSVLEWDLLMTQDIFEKCIEHLATIDLTKFSAIRVQDPGALFYLKQNYPKLKIQLILENGNHNTMAVKKWIELAGPQLERLVLSIELSKTKLLAIIEEITTPVEILGLGRILLFYTPRNLLSALYKDHEDELTIKTNPLFEGVCHSQETPHNGFPLVENRHGTFMFNTKDLFLLEYLNEIAQIGVEFLRIDLRSREMLDLWPDIKKLNDNFSKMSAQKIKKDYSVATIRGFFHHNKTDVLFKKLKNQLIQRSDENYLGDVIEVRKKEYMGIILRNKNLCLKIGQKISIKTPDGKEKFSEIKAMQSSSLESLDIARSGQVVFLKHINGVSVKSALYLVSSVPSQK